jgi:hypothetical protein
MVRVFVLGLVASLALAGAASACPYDKNAQATTTDQQQTSDSSQLPLPTDGTTTKDTKTGG